MRAKELREMSHEMLVKTLEERGEDIVNFRLQLATGVVENCRRAREARRDIARIKTIIRERELAASKGNE